MKNRNVMIALIALSTVSLIFTAEAFYQMYGFLAAIVGVIMVEGGKWESGKRWVTESKKGFIFLFLFCALISWCCSFMKFELNAHDEKLDKTEKATKAMESSPKVVRWKEKLNELASAKDRQDSQVNDLIVQGTALHASGNHRNARGILEGEGGNTTLKDARASANSTGLLMTAYQDSIDRATPANIYVQSSQEIVYGSVASLLSGSAILSDAFPKSAANSKRQANALLAFIMEAGLFGCRFFQKDGNTLQGHGGNHASTFSQVNNGFGEASMPEAAQQPSVSESVVHQIAPYREDSLIGQIYAWIAEKDGYTSRKSVYSVFTQDGTNTDTLRTTLSRIVSDGHIEQIGTGTKTQYTI